MSKEAYYFSHDANAKDDPKIVQVVDDLGLEGYGIFWVLVETLRNQPTYRYPLKLIPSLARKYNSTSAKIEVVVKNYGLFQIENEEFFSLSLNKRMELKEAKSLKARESANERWKRLQSERNAIALQTHTENDANAMRTECEGNAIKESKGNESKISYEEQIAFANDLFLGAQFLLSAIELWYNYKNERGEAYKSVMWLSSMEKQVKEFGETAVIDAIHVAIGSNYAGYFPKKSSKPQQTPANKYKISM